jgi:hypothetical protein
MTRTGSYDPHRVLGYFDIPSRSVPTSPQISSLPYSPVSRGSSPARDVRRSREYNYSHSGSDLEDALHGFSLVPSWLKLAMEKDQNGNNANKYQERRSVQRYSPLNSPDSIITSSGEPTPENRVPVIGIPIPSKTIVTINPPEEEKTSAAVEEVETTAEDDARYWDEEDEGYWGELEEEEQEEDLEACYRSVL